MVTLRKILYIDDGGAYSYTKPSIWYISTLTFSLWNGNLAQYLWFMVFQKATSKFNIRESKMVFKYHHSIEILYPRLLTSATEKVIKSQPCRICRQKTGSCCSWLVKPTRSKIPLPCTDTGKWLQIHNAIAALLILGCGKNVLTSFGATPLET